MQGEQACLPAANQKLQRCEQGSKQQGSNKAIQRKAKEISWKKLISNSADHNAGPPKSNQRLVIASPRLDGNVSINLVIISQKQRRKS